MDLPTHIIRGVREVFDTCGMTIDSMKNIIFSDGTQLDLTYAHVTIDAFNRSFQWYLSTPDKSNFYEGYFHVVHRQLSMLRRLDFDTLTEYIQEFEQYIMMVLDDLRNNERLIQPFYFPCYCAALALRDDLEEMSYFMSRHYSRSLPDMQRVITYIDTFERNIDYLLRPL